MKKLSITLLLSSTLIIGCSYENSKTSVPEIDKEVNITKEDINLSILDSENNQSSIETIKDEKVTEDLPEANNLIDTSVFENLKNIEIIDARDITEHITLKIDAKDNTNPGMVTLNILKDAYDFLLQEDIEGAKTITLLIRVNEVKVAQFNIYKEKFVEDDDIPMATLVVNASDIEFLHNDVKSFGETMELW